MSQQVAARFGSAVIWTVNAALLWDRFVIESAQASVEAIMLWGWFFIMGALSQIVWAFTAWLFVVEWADWAASPRELPKWAKDGLRMKFYFPDWPGAEFTRSWLYATKDFNSGAKRVVPRVNAFASFLYVAQAAAQLAAGPLDGPSVAQTIAVLVLSAASLASTNPRSSSSAS